MSKPKAHDKQHSGKQRSSKRRKNEQVKVTGKAKGHVDASGKSQTQQPPTCQPCGKGPVTSHVQIHQRSATIPPTPPGLDRNGRKRWRRRQRRSSRTAKPPIAGRSLSPSPFITEAAGSLHAKTPTPDGQNNLTSKSSFKSLCSTKLLPAPTRSWSSPQTTKSHVGDSALPISAVEDRNWQVNLSAVNRDQSNLGNNDDLLLTTRSIACRQSLSSKAYSVPTSSGLVNPEKAFAQFTAYLSGDERDDDDNKSESPVFHLADESMPPPSAFVDEAKVQPTQTWTAATPTVDRVREGQEVRSPNAPSQSGLFDFEGYDLSQLVTEVSESVFGLTAALPEASPSVRSSRRLANKALTLPEDVEDEFATSFDIHPNGDAETPTKKRKMTGMTSKHFSPTIRRTRARASIALDESAETEDTIGSNESQGLVAANTDVQSLVEDGASIDNPGQATAVDQPTTATRRVTRNMAATVLNSDSGAGGDGGDEGAANSARTQMDVTEDTAAALPPTTPTDAKPRTKRKGTARSSEYFKSPKPALDPAVVDRVDFYNNAGGNKRIPGVSTAPVPSIHSDRFGIIQEKLWKEPFWLLIALTFLNQTAGRVAAPVFWALKARYPTPEALAAADQKDLYDMIHHLGLHTTRSKRMIAMAQAWLAQPPEKGRRYRTLHYPRKGDGKAMKPDEILTDDDADDCAGALEIGHMPGCKTYAYDSWRMFCRDVLRGVAEDYNGKNAANEDFVPEWQKVLPEDKELRACMRWMWLREGWIWNHETGERRRATMDEMDRAVQGEMDVPDAQERKFAAQAAEAQEMSAPVGPATATSVSEDGNDLIVSSASPRRSRRKTTATFQDDNLTSLD